MHQDLAVESGVIVLFGGPAGAGKSTLSEAWAARRPRGVRLDLDEVRHRIRGGLLDPQVVSSEQGAQYETSARATAAMARAFAEDGYDVAVEEAGLNKGHLFFMYPWVPSAGTGWHMNRDQRRPPGSVLAE